MAQSLLVRAGSLGEGPGAPPMSNRPATFVSARLGSAALDRDRPAQARGAARAVVPAPLPLGRAASGLVRGGAQQSSNLRGAIIRVRPQGQTGQLLESRSPWRGAGGRSACAWSTAGSRRCGIGLPASSASSTAPRPGRSPTARRITTRWSICHTGGSWGPSTPPALQELGFRAGAPLGALGRSEPPKIRRHFSSGSRGKTCSHWEGPVPRGTGPCSRFGRSLDFTFVLWVTETR